jgi:hypothetical protein
MLLPLPPPPPPPGEGADDLVFLPPPPPTSDSYDFSALPPPSASLFVPPAPPLPASLVFLAPRDTRAGGLPLSAALTSPVPLRKATPVAKQTDARVSLLASIRQVCFLIVFCFV